MRGPTSADHRLVSLYRRYIGEPDRTADVFVGFGLFFGGIALGALGLVVFLVSTAVTPGSALYWTLREVAIVFAVVGLPGLLLSVVVLLPVARRAVYASIGGVALCLVSTGLFVASYPHAWNVAGQDHSPIGITVYAGGLTVLLASTGAALVAHHLERAGSTDSVPSSSQIPSSDDTVTDEEVQRDIDETVDAADLTWGGVESTESRRLTLSDEETDTDIDAAGLDVDADVRTDAGVDDSVSALRALRGWEPTQERGSGVDDQAEALRQLRERSAESDDETGLFQRLVHRFNRE